MHGESRAKTIETTETAFLRSLISKGKFHNKQTHMGGEASVLSIDVHLGGRTFCHKLKGPERCGFTYKLPLSAPHPSTNESLSRLGREMSARRLQLEKNGKGETATGRLKKPTNCGGLVRAGQTRLLRDVTSTSGGLIVPCAAPSAPSANRHLSHHIFFFFAVNDGGNTNWATFCSFPPKKGPPKKPHGFAPRNG